MVKTFKIYILALFNSSFLCIIILLLKISPSSSLSVLSSPRPLKLSFQRQSLIYTVKENHCIRLGREIALCLEEIQYNKSILSHYLKLNRLCFQYQICNYTLTK